MAIALPVMMARPRPRFRGDGLVSVGMAVPSGGRLRRRSLGRGRRCLWRLPASGGGAAPSSRGAAPSPGRPARSSGRPVPLSPAGRLPLRAGLLFPRLILPLLPLLRWGSLSGNQLRASRRGRDWPGLGGDVRPPLGLLRRPHPAGVRGRPEVTPCGPSSAGWAARRPAIPAVVCAGGSLPLLASGTRRGRGAGRSAGGADAWACALSRAARMRCRSESDSTGRVNGPVAGPRFRTRHTPWERGAVLVLCHANPPGCVHDGAIVPRQRSTKRSANQHKPGN